MVEQINRTRLSGLEPLDIGVFGLIMGQKSISGTAVGSPASIAEMLDFANQHEVKPVIEKFKFAQINEAMEHLRSGKVKYRIVLEN